MGMAAITTRLGRLLTRTSGEKSGGAHLKECDVRLDLHAPGNVTRLYGSDQSGTVLYEFNSKGYRGEEYDPAARFRICVIVESNEF